MNSTKRVNLALQGGGSHGAFTWGVLDALIEDGRLEFEALSGTSAVASPIQRTPLDRLQGNWNLDDSPAALWADLIQRTLSPWQRNPLKFDPLRELLRRHFDEKAMGVRLPGDQGLHRRHQRADRQGPHLHARGAVDRRPARLG